MDAQLSPERIAALRSQNILYFTKFDIEKMSIANLILRKSVKRKLWNVMFLSSIYSALMIMMSIDVVIPRIGNIGAYKPDGEVFLLTPQINPRVNVKHAYNYAVNVIQDLRTYGFLTYVDSILASEKYFSPQGFEQYLLNIESTGHIARIINNRENRLSIVSPEQSIWAMRRIEGSNAFWYVSVKLLTRIETLNGKDILLSENVEIKLKEVTRDVSEHGLLIEYIRD